MFGLVMMRSPRITPMRPFRAVNGSASIVNKKNHERGGNDVPGRDWALQHSRIAMTGSALLDGCETVDMVGRELRTANVSRNSWPATGKRTHSECTASRDVRSNSGEARY